jgi:hypothetical protein
MSEEYKKLSELPQAVNPGRCEAYGIENGKSVRVPLTFTQASDIEELTVKIQESFDDLMNFIVKTYVTKQEIKGAVKSNVSDNEAFNDVVKELYFDKECDVSKIAQIRIKRNGSSGDYLNIYEMFIIDTANKYHSCTFVGRTAEKDAVNAGTIYWSSGTSSLFPNETSRNVAMYAVIDWDKLTDQQGANKADTFEATISPRVNNIKFHPVIYSYVNMANMMGVSTLNEEEE